MIHHTAGPWTAHDDDGTGTLPCVLSDKVNRGGNFYVAQCNVFEDAKLCAAAPDLLEACEAVELTLLACLNKDGSWDEMPAARKRLHLMACQAAISKARGK